MQESHKILLSLGSNIGDREEFLKNAINLLKSKIFSEDLNIKVSNFYETEPFGEKNQNYFLNVAVSGITDLDQSELLNCCKSIEVELGRTNRERWMEREIDIDIILFDEIVYNSRKLNIPHPQLHLRKFVLVTSSEIEPEIVHPIMQKKIKELLDICADNSSVKIYNKKLR